MNPGIRKTSCYAALLLAFAAPVWSPAVADPAPAPLPAPVPAPVSAPQPSTTVPGGGLATNFTDFAGSPENSASLVNGLRTGSPITLTDPVVVGGPPPVSTTFTPPTKPMGYGNVRIALSLAQAQLANQGITNPTATELQGALMGTTVVGPGGTTTTDGVLQMRASGMGWGQIAHSQGYKLGPIMSGRQTFVTAAPTPTPTPHATTTRSSVTTAAGVASHGASTAKGKGVVTGASASSGGNKHVVTAAGGTPGGGGKGVTTGAGHANGHASGVTTGAGTAVHGQASGITTGLGHASANASGAMTAAGGKAGGNPNSNAGGNGKGGGKL